MNNFQMQKAIKEANKISTKLQNEIAVVEEMKNTLEKEIPLFLKWFCETNEIQVDQQDVMELWEKAKASFEIKQAGGIH